MNNTGNIGNHTTTNDRATRSHSRHGIIDIDTLEYVGTLLRACCVLSFTKVHLFTCLGPACILCLPTYLTALSGLCFRWCSSLAPTRNTCLISTALIQRNFNSADERISPSQPSFTCSAENSNTGCAMSQCFIKSP